jgi:hypothetical protein
VKQQREIMIGHQFVAQFAILSESSLEFIQRQGTTVIAVLMPEQFAPIDATKRIRRCPQFVSHQFLLWVAFDSLFSLSLWL